MSSVPELLPATISLLDKGNIKDAAILQCQLLTDGRNLTTRAPEDILTFLDGYKGIWKSRPKNEQDIWRQHAKAFLAKEFKYKNVSESILLLENLLGWQGTTPCILPDIIDVIVMNAMGVLYFGQSDFRSARKTYELAMALRLKHQDPPELPELLVNYGNLLAKEKLSSQEELTRATEYYRRAMRCDRRICGPFEDPCDNELKSNSTVRDSLAQIHNRLLVLEQNAAKESCSRRAQMATRLQAKLSRRSSQTRDIVETALGLMDTVPSLTHPSLVADVDASPPSDEAIARPAAKSKKNKAKSRKLAKAQAQAQARATESSSIENENFKFLEAEERPTLDEEELARSPSEWRSLLLQRDKEHAETKDELEVVSATLNDMILYCDRQQSHIDDLKRQIQDLQRC